MSSDPYSGIDPVLRAALMRVNADGSSSPMFPELQRENLAVVSVTFSSVSELSAHMRRVLDEIASDRRHYGTQVVYKHINITLEKDSAFGCWVFVVKENGKTLTPPTSFMSEGEARFHFWKVILPILYDQERTHQIYDPDI
jgi:hypothetical protein